MEDIAATLVLGAGASKPLGYLLTKDLLPEIKKEIDKKSLFEQLEHDMPKKDLVADRKRLAKFLNELFHGFRDAKAPDYPSITEVLSLVDYTIQHSQSLMPKRNLEDWLRFRRLLEFAIFYSIDSEDKDENKRSIERVSNKLRRFIDCLRGDNSIGIISTNYDIAVDLLLFETVDNSPRIIAEQFDFGIAWREAEQDELIEHERPKYPKYHLYKLHGSLNWLRCDLCEQTYVNVTGAMTHQAFRHERDGSNTCDCFHAPLKPTLIVPSLVRDIHDPKLVQVWERSLEVVRSSPVWIIVGYSLPYEDIAIRSILLRAFHSQTAAAKKGKRNQK